MNNTRRDPPRHSQHRTPDAASAESAAPRQDTEARPDADSDNAEKSRDANQFGADVAAGQFDDPVGRRQPSGAMAADGERDSTRTGGRIEPTKAPDPDAEKPNRPTRQDPVDERPEPARAPGSRRPYPVDDPGIADPDRPGSQPDYVPGRPIENPPSI